MLAVGNKSAWVKEWIGKVGNSAEAVCLEASLQRRQTNHAYIQLQVQ